MLHKVFLPIGLLLLIFAGCVISPRRDSSNPGTGGNASFTVSANPTTQTVAAGASASFNITVSPTNNFNGTVNLNATNVPNTMQASFSNTQVTGGTGTAQLTITTTASTPAGTSTITVTGTDASSNASQSVNVNITVQ
jgi:hypothetical protein